MANGIASAWRSFWHTMTSNDRHATHDSVYRTGRHLPLNQSRHAAVGAQATHAMESQTDLSGNNDSAFSPTAALNSSIRSPPPYSPGARTQMLRRGSSDTNVLGGGAGNQGSGGPTAAADPGSIQMQNFEEGAAPPPPVAHSWKRVDRWVEDNFPELYDQLGEGATQNDINELEHELNCSLPIDVRESISCHDGQERGGRPTGILFGCMLLDCEEIVQEWKNWRIVNEDYLSAPTSVSINIGSKGLDAGSSRGAGTSASAESAAPNGGPNPLWRQELLDKQDCHPPRHIQKAYAHAGWIPLARDWGGNCIAVDLAPGPAGKWGQVIIFGRDYDCKYVISRSWATFMAQVADDFGSGKVEVDEDSEWDGKMRLKLFKTADPPYLEINRWRTDQKYGRRVPKKRPGKAPGSGGPSRRGSGYGSPYGSPVDERGRSPQRFPAAAVGSPRASAARVNSPLAKVEEEGKLAKTLPLNAATGASANVGKLDTQNISGKQEKLIEAPTPSVLQENKQLLGNASEQEQVGATEGQAKKVVSSKKAEQGVGLGVKGLDEDLKTVQI